MQELPKQLDDFLAEAKEKVSTMSCEEYEDARRRKVDHALIDVREEDEFAEGHIEGAINIPRGEIEFKISEAVPNKATPIMMCCKTGRRALLAALTLVEMGYSDVRVLDGGYIGYCKFNGALKDS